MTGARGCASPRHSPFPRTSSRSPRASSASNRRSATAGRSACSTARPTPRRWRGTATRSSICTPSTLAWLEQYTGIPYPFGKFDFLLVPAFQFGGMEHPGAIFYNAPGLLLDESATQDQMLGRASVIAHETAHMWFGDLVTMRWFTDVWMKEVFANYMAAKIVNPAVPGGQPRPALPASTTTRPPTASIAPPAPTRSASRSSNLNEAGSALRRDHLPEGADRHAPARDARRRRRDSATACAST